MKTVILVHGFRTRGNWKNLLNPLLQDSGFRTELYDYGDFGLFKFLLPLARQKEYQKFMEFMSDVQVRQEETCVVAHSFGTMLVGQYLEDNHKATFDGVVFCGSILKEDFPWRSLINEGRVKYVLNDWSENDFWVQVAPYFVGEAGRAGRVGFSESHESLVQRNFESWTHSDYFRASNYRDWVIFLLGGKIKAGNIGGMNRARMAPFFKALLWILVLTVLLFLTWPIKAALALEPCKVGDRVAMREGSMYAIEFDDPDSSGSSIMKCSSKAFDRRPNRIYIGQWMLGSSCSIQAGERLVLHERRETLFGGRWFSVSVRSRPDELNGWTFMSRYWFGVCEGHFLRSPDGSEFAEWSPGDGRCNGQEEVYYFKFKEKSDGYYVLIRTDGLRLRLPVHDGNLQIWSECKQSWDKHWYSKAMNRCLP